MYVVGTQKNSMRWCLTWDRRAAGSSLTDVTGLWSLGKTHLSYLSTGSTQEDPSLYNWKIVDWDVKNQIKETNEMVLLSTQNTC